MTKTTPFLMYHRIAQAPPASNVPGHYVPPSRFRAHLRALKRKGYSSVSLQDYADDLDGKRSISASKPIVLTFDDGYEHWDVNAVGPMKTMGFTACLFIVAGRMGGTNTWDNQQGDVIESIADGEMIKKWSSWQFEIGNHSLNHADLVKTPVESLADEIEGAHRALVDLLGNEPRFFCYPYGSQNEQVRQAVTRAGYRGACSTRKGLNDADTDRFQWRRINVRSDTWTPFLFWKIKREERRHQGGA